MQTTSWSSAPPASRPRRPASWRRRSWTDSGCRLQPGEDQDRRTSTRGTEGFDFLGFHQRDAWSPGNGRVAGICRTGLPPRAMASIRARSARRTDRRYARLPLRLGGRGPQPRAAGLGQLLPLRKLRAEVRRRSTATSTNASRSSPAPSTDSKAANWATRFNDEWLHRLGVYRLTGTVRPTACVCQPVNDVGEPCAGEPHARCARDMTSSSGVRVPCGG